MWGECDAFGTQVAISENMCNFALEYLFGGFFMVCKQAENRCFTNKIKKGRDSLE